MAPREQRGQSPTLPSSSLCQLEGQLPAENRVAWPLRQAFPSSLTIISRGEGMGLKVDKMEAAGQWWYRNNAAKASI